MHNFYLVSYGTKVSDTGLLEVARRCSSLTVLELSRSELPFKVGDVTLMVRSYAGVTYTPVKRKYFARYHCYCGLPQIVVGVLLSAV